MSYFWFQSHWKVHTVSMVWSFNWGPYNYDVIHKKNAIVSWEQSSVTINTSAVRMTLFNNSSMAIIGLYSMANYLHMLQYKYWFETTIYWHLLLWYGANSKKLNTFLLAFNTSARSTTSYLALIYLEPWLSGIKNHCSIRVFLVQVCILLEYLKGTLYTV